MSGSGYGDALTVEELIAEKQGLARFVAVRSGVAVDDLDDAAQEAALALWQVARAKPDASPAYLNGVVARRVKDVARGGRLTGQEAQQGRQRTRSGDAATLDDPDHPIELVGAEILAGVELAYHYGEIMRAIAALTPARRRYVVMRFWGGLSDAEIAARLEVKAETLSTMWRRFVRPELAERLGHLASAV